ncbi:MAG: hypothetical protein JWN77_702 [Frankiales bacterium]|nr:hypothetical protein [Frankiales bacterium]
MASWRLVVAYDQDLADRLRLLLGDRRLAEQVMFGGRGSVLERDRGRENAAFCARSVVPRLLSG